MMGPCGEPFGGSDPPGRVPNPGGLGPVVGGTAKAMVSRGGLAGPVWVATWGGTKSVSPGEAGFKDIGWKDKRIGLAVAGLGAKKADPAGGLDGSTAAA